MLMLLLAACNPDNGVTVYGTPPNATITHPEFDARVTYGETVELRGRVNDAQDSMESLKIAWSSDLDGVLTEEGTADAAGVTAFPTTLSPGRHTVTLTVTDSDAEETWDAVSFDIEGLEDVPTLQVQSPKSTDLGEEGEPFDFLCHVEDLQDAWDELYVEIWSDLDGEVCGGFADVDGEAGCLNTLGPGQHELTFSVEDTEGFSFEKDVEFYVLSDGEIDDDGDGYTEDEGDCDDNDETVNPGGVEGDTGNGKDDNCNGTVDEGTNLYDDDGDGYTEEEGDCDDSNKNRNPSVLEICGDGLDNNCNGAADEENASGCDVYYKDSDGDGYGSNSAGTKCLCSAQGSWNASQSGDCYDSDSLVKPGVTTYYDYPHGGGSYDWNCDGNETKELTQTYACSANLIQCTSWTNGWNGSVPACGNTGSWYSGCSGSFWSCSKGSSTSTTQTCR